MNTKKFTFAGNGLLSPWSLPRYTYRGRAKKTIMRALDLYGLVFRRLWITARMTHIKRPVVITIGKR